MVLGRNIDRIERNIESIESKFAKIFKRPKNREDGSDFDDFWTESIVSTQSIFSKIFERTRNYRIDQIDRFDQSVDPSIVSIDGRLVHAKATASLLHGSMKASPLLNYDQYRPPEAGDRVLVCIRPASRCRSTRPSLTWAGLPCLSWARLVSKNDLKSTYLPQV